MASLMVFASGGASVGFIILLALYFVPAIVAFTRHHHNQWAIFALNLLLGWTLLGWVGALIWSLTRPSPERVVHVYHDQSQPPAGAAPPADPPAES